MSKAENGAIEILKADHARMKELFEKFEEEQGSAQREIAQEAMKEFKIHSLLEEEIFDPAVRANIQDDENLVNEAQEEHHVAKLLIAELEQMEHQDDHFAAKFMVLAENVRHHFREEEKKILPAAKKADINLEMLGEQMIQRRQELLEGGIPATKEEAVH